LCTDKNENDKNRNYLLKSTVIYIYTILNNLLREIRSKNYLFHSLNRIEMKKSVKLYMKKKIFFYIILTLISLKNILLYFTSRWFTFQSMINLKLIFLI
jgi:hypothetical protein